MGEGEEETGDGPGIGIDLGTTCCRVAVWQDDHVEIIPNEQGNRATPSIVAITDSEFLVGDAAKNQLSDNPANSLYDVKRLIGKRFDSAAVKSDMKHFPFKVNSGPAGWPMLIVQHRREERQLSAESVSSMILRKVKETAEAYLGRTVKSAVLSVPSNFNSSQRLATVAAGTLAGLKRVSVLNETSAAAVAYAFRHKGGSSEAKNVLIFHLGGGSFSASLVFLKDELIQVKAIDGDANLGGKDFDNRLVDHFARAFKRKYNKDINHNARSMRRLRDACERAKRSLSSAAFVKFQIDNLYENTDFCVKVSRAMFEELIMDLLRRCIESVKRCLEVAEMDKGRVDDIIIIGGSTAIPKVQQLLRDFFDGKELCKNMNPHEAVAYGAASLAAVKNKNMQVPEVNLVDVMPQSLGVEVAGGAMCVVLAKGTPLPVRKQHMFSIVEDNATSVTMRLYEGEGALIKDNEFVGSFLFSSIVPAPGAKQSMVVCFDVDLSGTFRVSAKMLDSRLKVDVTANWARLGLKELQEMRLETEKLKLEDETYKKRLAAMNMLESSVYKKRKIIREKREACRRALERIGRVEGDMEEVIRWCYSDKETTSEDCDAKAKELEDICKHLL